MNNDNETIERKAAKAGLWLAGFKWVAQCFSWGITIIIARILAPQDYGLMEMATILTGYVALFSEIGLGAAIIQRGEAKDEELSSLFWFLVSWGFILALIGIILAYPTVVIFKEKKLLLITQTASLLFIIGSFIIVPLNILNRQLKFKTIGFTDAVSVIISCLVMIAIARAGGGVWTLIGGHIVREFIRAILIFSLSTWRPKLQFDFKKIKPYLRYGLNIAGTNSLSYIYTKSDRFFGGKSFGANTLGYYTLALQLSSIPTDKLISLINYVSFPVFSRYQRNYDVFNKFYLRLVNLIALISFPVFIGGIFVADELIPFVLGAKWAPLIFPFKLLCMAQLIISITTADGVANNAQGRPHWGLYINLVNVLTLPVCFYIASRYGLNALAIPWITICPILRFAFTMVTIRKLNISILEYLGSIIHPLLASLSMLIILFLIKHLYLNSSPYLFLTLKSYLCLTIVFGGISYILYNVAFQRPLLISFLNLAKR